MVVAAAVAAVVLVPVLAVNVVCSCIVEFFEDIVEFFEDIVEFFEDIVEFFEDSS